MICGISIMSILTLDNLDDPLLDAGTGQFVGLNSRVRPALIPDNELSKNNDGRIGETGMVETRYPAKCIQGHNITPASAQGIGMFDTPTKEVLIAGINKKLYSAGSLYGTTWTDLSHTLYGDVTFAQLDNKLFFVDGYYYYYWDGSTFTEVTTFDGSTTLLPHFEDIISHGNRILLSRVNDTAYNDDEIYASDLLDGTAIDSTYSIRVGAGDGDPIVKILSWFKDFVAVLKEKSVYVVNTSSLIGTAGGGATDPVNWVIEKVTDSMGCVAPKTVVNVGNDIWFLSREGLTSLRRVKESQQRQISAIVLNTPVNDVFEDVNWDDADTASAAYYNNRFYISLPISPSKVPNATLVYDTRTQKWSGKYTGTAWKPYAFVNSSFKNNRHLVFQDSTGNVYWEKQTPVHESQDQLPSVVTDSGSLVVGESYLIYNYQSGDNFTTVGASSNATGIEFVATGTNPTWVNNSYLAKYTYEDIDLDSYTKAFDFGYPVNYKDGFNLEVDFYRSQGTVSIYLIPDDDEANIVTIATGVSTGDDPTLPQTSPFTLNGDTDKRVVYEIPVDLPPFKELKVRILGANASIKTRRVQITGFLNTMDIMK